MSNCSKHKSTVEKYDGDLKSLAEDIGNLKYDDLANFLGYLSEKLNEDGDKDSEGGRLNLARNLHTAAMHVQGSKISIMRAWQISKPYMK